jgi:hypothetical protein
MPSTLCLSGGFSGANFAHQDEVFPTDHFGRIFNQAQMCKGIPQIAVVMGSLHRQWRLYCLRWRMFPSSIKEQGLILRYRW